MGVSEVHGSRSDWATDAAGTRKITWLAMISEAPERRRRSRCDGNAKRLLMKLKERTEVDLQIQAEYHAGMMDRKPIDP